MYSTNDSIIPSFHDIFSCVARPFEKLEVTAPMIVNLLSQPLRRSFIIASPTGLNGRRLREALVPLKTGKEGLPTQTSCQWVLSGKTDEGDPMPPKGVSRDLPL